MFKGIWKLFHACIVEKITSSIVCLIYCCRKLCYFQSQRFIEAHGKFCQKKTFRTSCSFFPVYKNQLLEIHEATLHENLFYEVPVFKADHKFVFNEVLLALLLSMKSDK